MEQATAAVVGSHNATTGTKEPNEGAGRDAQCGGDAAPAVRQSGIARRFAPVSRAASSLQLLQALDSADTATFHAIWPAAAAGNAPSGAHEGRVQLVKTLCDAADARDTWHAAALTAVERQRVRRLHPFVVPNAAGVRHGARTAP